MPVIHRFGAMSIRLYADNHHPPHFHIVSSDFEVVVRISDLSIVAGTVRASEISDVIDWARENKELLNLKWTELNKRG